MLISLLIGTAVIILLSTFAAGYRLGQRDADELPSVGEAQASAEVVRLERYATSLEEERDRLQAILKAGREVQ